MKETTRQVLFNGSGYYDGVAYQAIMNVSREVEAMGMRSDYQDGDIVEVTKQNGVVEEMLLLRCHDGYATAVILKEKAPAENSSAVISRQKMYFDAGRPCYVYYDSIGQYIKTVNASELERIRKKVGEAIGLVIPDVGEVKQDPVKLIDQDTLDDLAQRFSLQLVPVHKGISDLVAGLQDRDKTIRLEAERDIWKELYEKERAN